MRGPGKFRWVPTSELELYNAEAAILGPIRPIISQRTVAGLNTISSVHPKVPKAELPAYDPREEEVPTPPCTPVAAGSAPDVASPTFDRSLPTATAASAPRPDDRQLTALRPLDKDSYGSIVFIHGYAGGVANWIPIWRQYANDYDLYAVDIPGFGRNPRPAGLTFPTPQSAIDWYVGQFEAWFTAMRLGLEDVEKSSEGEVVRPAGRKVIITAHSFGGYLASHLVMRHPSLADHLVLVDGWGINRFRPRSAGEEAKRKKEMSRVISTLDSALEGVYWGKLLSFCGPLAQKILPVVRPEFSDSWGPFLEDPKHFYTYSYHCNVQRPYVGEAAFEAIRVKEGITAAALPLIDRTHLFPFASEERRAAAREACIAAAAAEKAATAAAAASVIQNGKGQTASSPPHPPADGADQPSSDGVTPTPSAKKDKPSRWGKKSSPTPSVVNGPPCGGEVDADGLATLGIGPSSIPYIPGEAAQTTTDGSPSPTTAPLRHGFKVTMLYGGDSWLRSPVLEEFAAALRDRNGLDVSFNYIDNAGHMPLVDNMPMFCDVLGARLRVE